MTVVGIGPYGDTEADEVNDAPLDEIPLAKVEAPDAAGEAVAELGAEVEAMLDV